MTKSILKTLKCIVIFFSTSSPLFSSNYIVVGSFEALVESLSDSRISIGTDMREYARVNLKPFAVDSILIENNYFGVFVYSSDDRDELVIIHVKNNQAISAQYLKEGSFLDKFFFYDQESMRQYIERTTDGVDP